MPVYICELCNYSTKIKTQLERHKNTKKHRNRCLGIDEQIVVYGGMKKKDPERPEKTQKDPLETHEDPEEPKKIEKKKKTFFCDFCNSGFTTFAHKRRHELHRCNANYNKLLDAKNNEIAQLKNEKQEIYKKIDKLLEKVGNTTNIQNNIHVNNYGNEDLTHISKSMMDDLITIPYRMIPKMIAAVHFNDEKPQNKNIFIPNKKDKFVKIFKNNKWIYQDREKAINKLVDDKYNVIDNHYVLVDKHDVIEDNVKTNYLQFKKYYDDGDKEFIEKLKKECEMVLLNNR
tara:strand:+ start:166 stop:1026 length:861 start_codon:yes stop_codon:yes gene_type:complete